MAPVRRFSSLPHAKRYIYEQLHLTLDTDLNGGQRRAVYIFDQDFSERDQERVEKAARQVLTELYRKAQPPSRGR